MEIKTKDALEYEINSSINVFKKLSTWINIVAGIALVSAVFQKQLLVLICLVIIFILKLKMDVESGEVLDYYRRKNNIPNQTRIREMKNGKR
jgi:hypothetical protein